MRFEQIVVGVDFSPNSRKALNTATQMQHDGHLGITAVHVIDRTLVRDLKRHQKLGEEELRNLAHRRLQGWVLENTPATASVSCETVIGEAYEAVIHAVDRHRADLLVLGSRGVDTKAGHPGTVASKCVRKAVVDVLLVRRAHDGPFRRVVACLDDSDSSRRAFERARWVARRDHAAFDVMHVHVPYVLSGIAMDPFPPIEDASLRRSLAEADRAQFEGWVEELVGDGEPKPSRVFREAGSATDGILDWVHESTADLLALGTHGRSGFRAFLLGTTAERLLNESPCSILVAKAG